MSTNIKQHTELLAKARAIAESAQAAGRNLTTSEVAQVEGLLEKAKQLRGDIDLERNLDALASQVDLRPGSRGAKARPVRGSRRGLEWQSVEINGKSLVVSGTAGAAEDFGVFSDPSFPRRIADLFPKVRATSSEATWLSMTTNLVADSGSGSSGPYTLLQVDHLEEKPYGTKEYERRSEPWITFAELSAYIAAQDASDAPDLIADLSSWLADDIGDAVDQHVLDEIADAVGTPVSFADNAIDTVRKGLTALQEARVSTAPGEIALCVSPSAAEALDLTKADTAGTYLLPSAPTAASDPMFGVRVVVSNRIDEGKGYMVNPTEFARFGVREALRVEADLASGWSTNSLRYRAEMRGRLMVVRAAAAVEIDLAA